MTALPSVAVIVTCFNYGRYVASAIESVLSQAYAKCQLVIVNDGSTDDSSAVIEAYRGRATIIEQDNRGSEAAYNRGLEAAQPSDIVILLDADDLLAPGSLEEITRAWHPACAKVQYDLAIIDAAGAPSGRRFCNFDGTYDAARVRQTFLSTGTYRWPVTVGNAYSRWFIDRVFPLKIGFGPDGALNTIAPLYGEVVTINRTLGSYRVHGANLWSSNGSDYARLPVRIHQRQREVALMREHAANQSVAIPQVNVLDYELPFVNYRLMAFKLGLDYDGKASDSVAKLFLRGRRLAEAEGLPLRLRLAHTAWFLGLSLAPPAMAAQLIRFRFNRDALVGPIRQALNWIRI